jgi:hypothetical protein
MSVDQLTKKEVDAFGAIKEFVSSLNTCFGAKSMRLALYNRLVETAKIGSDSTKEDVIRIRYVILGFTEFCNANEKCIVERSLNNIPKGSRILYNGKDTISVDIKHFVSNSTADVLASISDHLLTIIALVGNQKALSDIDRKLEEALKPAPNPLDTIDSTTAEGKFIHDMISKTQSSFTEGNVPADPMQAAMMMMSSGIFQDMTTGLSRGVQTGELDVRKLFSIMQSSLSAVLPPSVPIIEEVNDVVSSPIETLVIDLPPTDAVPTNSDPSGTD